MRAGWYDDLGPARQVLQFGDLTRPEPGPGEVLVRLATSGINPSDVKSRSGAFGRARFLGRTIPHSDGGGVIVGLGAGVAAAREGQRVWIWNGQYGRPFGTAAEFIALPSALAVPLPDHIGFDEAACLGIPAMTACQAIRAAELSPGDWVLVSGGAGAVGHYAIQFAKARGARVIATISSPAKAAHAMEAGADLVVNYRNQDVAAQVRDATAEHGLSALIEMDLNANAPLMGLLRPFGRAIVYGVSGADVPVPGRVSLQASLRIQFVYVYEQPPELRAAIIREISALLARRRLINAIGARFPLAEIAAAHEAVEQGSLGNVVLEIG